MNLVCVGMCSMCRHVYIPGMCGYVCIPGMSGYVYIPGMCGSVYIPGICGYVFAPGVCVHVVLGISCKQMKCMIKNKGAGLGQYFLVMLPAKIVCLRVLKVLSFRSEWVLEVLPCRSELKFSEK